ncbi:hypothetical protein GCM10011613_32010 [Cellvibrio zantedeschiae]|uniref:Uncharacterized protein n=1 Tax=Cellvibrio zantedeschiae TaxID=1237077 RepID=A0ABQ3BA46_9GAMM|nr:hypothetical protein [Cellvibrio zantedeschiae]GGY84626.1 hypothetical protein GCM10011613_32010 [Cellvibrio zantedeschiae]
MEFLDHPKLILLVAFLSIPLYLTIARGFWGENFESLGEAIKYLLWPDWYSLYKGKFDEDANSSTMVTLYIILCVGWALAVTEIICRHFLN